MKSLLLLCTSLLITMNGLLAQSYWNKISSPEGGSLLNLVATDEGICYAYDVDLGHIFRSDDHGASWAKMNFDIWQSDTTLYIGPTGTFYRIIVSQPNMNVVIQSLECSKDEGETWTLVCDSLPGSHFRETRAGTCVSTGINGHLYSTDGGQTWLNAGGPFWGGGTDYVEMQPGMLLKWHMLTHSAVLSIDGGRTWQWFNVVGLPKQTDKIVAVNTDVLIAFHDSTAYRTVDRGNTWQVGVSMPISAKSCLVVPSKRILIADGGRRAAYSDDLGASWHMLSGTQPNSLIHAFSDSDLLGLMSTFLSASYVRSSDGGLSWISATSGLNFSLTYEVAFLSDSILLATSFDGVDLSEDGGLHWAKLMRDTAFRSEWTSVGTLNKDTFLVAMGGNLMLTIDGGKSFRDISPAMDTLMHACFIHPATHRILARTEAGTFKTDDWGKTWASIADAASRLLVHPSGNIYGWDPEYNDRLLRSSDGGLSWQDVSPDKLGIGDFKFASINSAGTIVVAGISDMPSISITLLVAISHDEGNTWEYQRIPSMSQIAYLTAIQINDIGHIFVGTIELGSFADVNYIWCTLDEGQSWFALPDIQGPMHYIGSLGLSPQGHLYSSSWIAPSIFRSAQSTLQGGYIRGSLLKDADADCSTPDPSAPLTWPISIEGAATYYVRPSSSGQYGAFVADTGTYQVSTQPSNTLWWTVCDSVQAVQVDSLMDADTVNITAAAAFECPLMQVDVSAPMLKRCFDNQVFINYCNIGTEPADSAWIEVELDDHLTWVHSDHPYDSLSPHLFRFPVGTVQSDACGWLYFTVYVDCDSTMLGQTHCILAHAWPDTLCGNVPNWSGANIEAEAHCIGDSIVQLTLRNTGTNFSQMLEYIIIEDDIVLMKNLNSYDPGEELIFEFPAQGRTWRIESAQEPGHPFSNLAIAFTEGCEGFNSLGFINQFDINGIRPAWDRFCLENTGAYDPNDKTGFPLGHGPDHRIRPGQEMEYLIRFQNTGTDTAFTVIIRDSISRWLDPSSVRPGAASHPYTWSLDGQGVLSFRFDHILLPDSNANLLGSQGFVSYRIRQQPEVPLGTEILNSAAIYFDFNPPVITNQTRHTVGLGLLSGTRDVPASGSSDALIFSPNPVSGTAVLRLREGVFQRHRLSLLDVLGRTLWQGQISGSQYVWDRKGLPPGVYAYRLEDEQGRATAGGKVVLK